MTAAQAPTAYVTPECREAHNLHWDTGHQYCPGPLEVRQGPGVVPLEVLKCACRCHAIKPRPA
jgi:hypothetical protein